MQIPNWKVLWWMSLTTSTLLSCFGMIAPVFGQCFTDNDDSAKTSNAGTQDGSLEFALSLFKSVVSSPNPIPASGNFHISPISVRAALTVTYLGARGTTMTEMGKVLGNNDMKQKKALELYLQLKKDMMHNATKEKNYTVNIADRLYFDKSAELRQCMVDYLKSELQRADFESAPEASRQIINKWVKDQTNEKIVDLIPKGYIDPSKIKTSNDNDFHVMVIVNAIYFKAAWKKTFNPKNTKTEEFFVEPKKSKQVSMMHQKMDIPYASSSSLDCAAVELAYSGDEISMVVLLPNSNAKDLMSKLTVENLNDLLGKMSPITVKLSLPKFKLTQSFELTKNLQALGMSDAFSSKADFSGFTGKKEASISFVQHKTFIEVNEDGSEAAAATAIGIKKLTSVRKQIVFRVDRPFFFAIRHKKSKHIMFMGLIIDPTAEN